MSKGKVAIFLPYPVIVFIYPRPGFILRHGRPQTFFQGRAKIFQGEGQEPTFCLKSNKNDTIFPKKV